MAHISMSLDDVCETSPRMWKMLKAMLESAGYAARGWQPIRVFRDTAIFHARERRRQRF